MVRATQRAWPSCLRSKRHRHAGRVDLAGKVFVGLGCSLKVLISLRTLIERGPQQYLYGVVSQLVGLGEITIALLIDLALRRRGLRAVAGT